MNDGIGVFNLTIGMAMMLDSNTQHFERMHSDAGALDPLLAFEYHIHRPRK